MINHENGAYKNARKFSMTLIAATVKPTLHIINKLQDDAYPPKRHPIALNDIRHFQEQCLQ